ncbi:MAG: DUF4364 family protein [Candidatus Avoscillospira sp.]
MERHGFIHDILDVKILILYVMALVEDPVTAQTIYELCYQDECLSYFDVQEAIPQMVTSGHLSQTEDGLYVITDKGRETEEITQDAIAFPVKQRAKNAVEHWNRKTKRDQFLRTEIRKRESGDYMVVMGLDDYDGPLMNLELTAPNLQQARKLEAAYRKNAEAVYQSVMVGLLDEAEREDTENL